MQPLRTRPRTTLSPRPYFSKRMSSRYPFSRHSSGVRPVKPQSFQLSPSRLNSLFVLAVVMMVSGLAFGWGIANFSLFVHPGTETTAANLHPSHPAYASVQYSLLPQSTSPFSDADVPSTAMPELSPTVDPHLLVAHADTGAYLTIPSIDLYVPVETTNIGANGRLQMPLSHQWDGVGWYSGGPYPGQQGSSVIDGYYERPDGSPAAFNELATLHPNDKMSFIDQQGDSIDFRVLAVHTYAPDQAPIDSIFGDNSGVYLNLITNVSNGTHWGQLSARQVVVHAVIDS